MERFLNLTADAKNMSPLPLAFVGDCVFELFVREKLVCEGNCPVKELHKQAVSQVRCQAQAVDCEVLKPLLTEEEALVLKRGRNSHTNHVPKNASTADYHAATGLECLFGYLYLQGRLDRLRLFFDTLVKAENNTEENED